MHRFSRASLAALFLWGVSACAGGGNVAAPNAAIPAVVSRAGGSLGPILSTSDGGQILASTSIRTGTTAFSPR
jgi:hypothetical protein